MTPTTAAPSPDWPPTWDVTQGQAARYHHIYNTGERNLAARLTTGDDDGMAHLCTLVGALVLARATRGNPISEELLQAARTALTDNAGR
ncbi:hypothetical protein [Streptomyces sp. NPDC054804]